MANKCAVVTMFVKYRLCSMMVKAGLTLHDFCRAVYQIGYDKKRCVIAEDRVI